MWKAKPAKSAQNLFDLFNPNEAYRLRTLEELNSSVPTLNRLKGELSTAIGFYLRGHESEFDIPRLCRALAAPDAIAEEFMGKRRISLSPAISGRLSSLHFTLLTALNDSLHPRATIGDDKDKESALLEDMLEIRIYMKMYCNIERIFREDSVSASYPFGNPFGQIAQMLNDGAAIIRFKYVGEKATGEGPREMVVSYHPLLHGGKALLGVHVEGDERFSMSKFWGTGDETLAPLSEKYRGRIIRWGKEDVIAALRGAETGEEFLY
ncbi:MAG: hypothetical protein KGH65_04020 [Candidatus Micrarchaeota archaeon]|nr:hypothetical protein [Candidatus Micrarchaeota archaeon]